MVEETLKTTFRPEFLNRIDDIVIFNSLTKDDISKITSLVIKDLEKRLSDKKIEFNLTQKAKDWIIDNGYDEIYGARPLKRLLKNKLENKLALAILEGKVKDYSKVIIDEEDNDIVLKDM